jgi:hypothetical protein
LAQDETARRTGGAFIDPRFSIDKNVERGKMDVKLAALADFASMTREGKLNILGVFDVVRAPGFPVVHPMMSLVVVFEASVAEADSDKAVNIILMGADGQRLFAAENTLRFGKVKYPGTRPSTNLVIALAGVQFATAGDYQFSILVNGEEKKALMLTVEPTPTGAQGAPNA